MLSTTGKAGEAADMTNYDLIQLMPKSKLAHFMIEFLTAYRNGDKAIFPDRIASEEIIEAWLSKSVREETEEWEKLPIAKLDLTPSVYEALYVAGIVYFGDLMKYRAYDLMRIPHIGESGLKQILERFETETGARLKP